MGLQEESRHALMMVVIAAILIQTKDLMNAFACMESSRQFWR